VNAGGQHSRRRNFRLIIAFQRSSLAEKYAKLFGEVIIEIAGQVSVEIGIEELSGRGLLNPCNETSQREQIRHHRFKGHEEPLW
jgi:hypothetical protein